MTSEYLIKFTDDDYTVKVTHNFVTGLRHICFHKKLENTAIDSKFDMYLTNEQYKDLCKFLCFINNEESNNGE